MSKNIYVHVGAPKTATTFIQEFLKKNRGALEEYGYGLVLPDDIRDTIYFNELFKFHTGVCSFSDLDIEAACSDFENHVLRHEFANVIVSEEGFLHNLMPSSDTAGAFGGVEETCRVLSSYLEGEATIVLTIRSQASFIESSYKHKIKWQSSSMSFGEYFLKGVNAFRLSWKTVVDVLESYFPGRVRVVPFEIVKSDERRYLDVFLDSCGLHDCGEEFLYDLPDYVKNDSMADVELRFLKALNLSLEQIGVIDEGRRYEAIKFVRDICEGKEALKYEEFRLPMHWKKSIQEYYHDENIALLSQYCSADILGLVSSEY